MSVKAVLVPWLLAPLGAVVLGVGYFALLWTEVLHQVEGGVVVYAVRSVVSLVEAAGKGG